MPDLQTHPWNHEFAWRSPEPPFAELRAEQADAFDRDGFVVVPDVFDASELRALVAELDELEAVIDALLASQPDGRIMIAEAGAITFAVHAVLSSAAARAATRHHRLLGLCRDLVGPDVRLYWDQAVYKKPDKPRRFPWHQDNGYTFVEPQQYLTCWIALTDATLDNGCPWVVPGAHRAGTLLHHWVDPLGWECFEEPPAEPVAAPVPAGGVVVFSSLTPHLTGPNTTADVRKSYIVQYAPDGAAICQGDPASGPPSGSQVCDDDTRQYTVLRDGEVVH